MRDALGGVQRVLVLGGTSEIGLAIVDELAGSGRLQEVVLACRRPIAAEAAIAALSARGVAARSVPFEATSADGHAGVMADARRGGDVDVVIVAVGQLADEADLRADPVATARLVSVNAGGAIAATTAAAQALTEQGHGTIVVLSSVAGVRVRADNATYGATKAALDGFALALADDLAGTGVDVVVVRPGFVRTRMTTGMAPAPFSTDPATVAAAVAAAIADGRRLVWVPGILRWVFLVLGHLPAPLWRRVAARQAGGSAR